MSAITAITRAQISPEWIEERRAIVAREGFALRAGRDDQGGDTLTIQIKTQRPAPTVNTWITLTLPGGALAFTTAIERDMVLHLLQQPNIPTSS